MVGHAGTHARATEWPEGHTGHQRCVESKERKKERKKIGGSRLARHTVWPQKEPKARVNPCMVIRCWVWWQGTGG